MTKEPHISEERLNQRSPEWTLWTPRWLSGAGVLLGLAFFAASLTPSLVPRDAVMQGVLGGSLFGFGYILGIILVGFWFWLGMPQPSGRTRRSVSMLMVISGVVLAAIALANAAEWQNSIRLIMNMEPLETAHPIRVAGIAIGTAVLLFIIVWVILVIFHLIARPLDRIIPERIAIALGIAAALFVFATAVNGVLVSYALRIIDSTYAALDALIEPGTAPPTDHRKSGSPDSLVTWQDLGNAGRRFIDDTPTRADIETFWQQEAEQPLRVYVGLNSADTVAERAQIALQELIRVGGLERSVLVVGIPTGTGFMEQRAIETLEYLHRGDVATVGMQYSYLQSPFSLVFEPGYGGESARALLRTIYDYWTRLPHNSRPKLYLQGLSLGALSSEQSVRLHEVLGDPFQGALWSGPPFPGTIHRTATEEREPGSPPWLPVFEDGSFIRFTNQQNGLDLDGAPWGPMRLVYLQYGSDPIVFFRTSILWHRPAWLAEPRAPDVSPAFRWYPVVTALQLVADMIAANHMPVGYGHQYAPSNYIDAWVAITEPEIEPSDIKRLKQRFQL